jgi:hypothetical protein
VSLAFPKKKKNGTLVSIFLFDFKIYPQNIRLKKYDGCIYYNLHFNNIMHKLNYKDELKSADKKIMWIWIWRIVLRGAKIF